MMDGAEWVRRNSLTVGRPLEAAKMAPDGGSAALMVQELGRALGDLSGRLQKLEDWATAPREVVRDPKTGRPTGFRIGDTEMNIEGIG